MYNKDVKEAIEEMACIKSVAGKLDTFLESLTVEELRQLYRMNENNALNQYIIHHGKNKKS